MSSDVRVSRWRSYRYAGSRQPRTGAVQSGDIFLGLTLLRASPAHQCNCFGVRQCHTLHRDVRHAPLLHRTGSREELVLPTGLDPRRCDQPTLSSVSPVCSRSFRAWLSGHAFDLGSPDVRWFHSNAGSCGFHPTLDSRIQDILSALSSLCGTIEPRKGHAQALDAFDVLWRNGQPMQLVSSARVGWKVEGLLSKLRKTTERRGHRLHWLDDADDETLNALYAAARGVLMQRERKASGYRSSKLRSTGSHYSSAIFPVFREIAGGRRFHFSAQSSQAFANEISQWLQETHSRTATIPARIPRQNWAESARQLLAQLPLRTSNINARARILICERQAPGARDRATRIGP